MLQERYYDPIERRLVYCSQRASPEFWDAHWERNYFEQAIKGQRNWFIIKITRHFLNHGSRVIDGGCGWGDKVYSLNQAGFDAYGVDYTVNTVKLIHQYAPGLKIFHSDVRELPFKTDFFDGYWSLGVIEHFYEGYDSIASEMARVLRPGGYLFLMFPCMSPLRRLKSRLSSYPNLPGSFDPEKDRFYQFALNVDTVVDQLKRLGFHLRFKLRTAGVKGIKDEIPSLKPFLQRLFNSTSLPLKSLRVLLDVLLSPFGGHGILLILRK
ncbi:class I SAM-dependent methyltransferase [Thermodesulfobacteriota bacterium]